MRILKLRLCNLNSLVGCWEIDFTNPQYVSEGLFAITGATGAGKTTILDAICLALYGQTPRLGRITKSDNDIMSRQHGECWAEVCFATEQGEYRARWYQRRARRSAEGALQQAQHTLSELESGTILEESLSAVPIKVEALCGLNFERFMRSMMLAQGQFAAFLNAKESERSELLEQLTGTDIYAQISKRVFARSKAEKETLASLRARVGDINVLSEEQALQLCNEVADKQSVIQKLRAEKQQTQALQEWVAKLTSAQQEAQQLAGEQQGLQRAQAEFAIDLARLEQDKKVRPYASDLKQYDYFVGQQQIQRKRQQALAPKLEALHSELEQVKQSLETAREDEQAQQNAWRDIQEQLEGARQADVRIGLAERDHNAAQSELSELQAQVKRLSDNQNHQVQQKRELTEQLKSIGQWLETHAEHEKLPTQLALVQRDQDRVAQLTQRIIEQRARRDTLRQEYKAMAAMPLAEAQQQAVTAGAQRVRELQSELKAAQHELEQDKLQQRFEEQRHLLVDGEPCPLCGSSEHPFAEQDDEHEHSEAQGVGREQSLVQAEATVTRLNEALDKANEALHGLKLQQAIGAAEQQRTLEQLKEQGEQCNHEVQLAQSEQQKMLTQWRQHLLRWKVDVEAAELPSAEQPSAEQQLEQIAGVLEQAANDYQSQQREQHRLQQQLDQSIQGLGHLDEQLTELSQRVEAQQSKQATTDEALQHAQRARKQYFDGRDVRDVEQQQQQLLKQAATRLQQTQQQHQELNEQRVALESEKRHLDEAHSEVEAALKSTLARLQQGVEKLGMADIKSLAQGLLEDAEQQRLADRADSLRARAQKLEVALQRNAQDIVTASKQQPEDPALNQQRLTAVESELSDAQRDIGRLEQLQRQDTEAREQHQKLLEQIAAQQAVYDNWATLDGMIGSADGKKYRNFAQGLTFDIMITYANQKLEKMSDRYALIRDTEAPLALNVNDDYQGGEIRSTRNLSGGESFIVSLALALGLAQMASSRVRVDSLFLDEGFGTLDPDTLDVALDTLASLRQEGKMIGLISHVGALKERIPTQLQVEAGAAGRSRLHGPGVRELSE